MSEVAMRIIEKHEQPIIKRDMGRDLPKGVYLDTRNGRYEAQVWKRNGKPKSIGVFDTPEEASYVRKCKLDGHHWTGMPEDRSDYFGFTYEMRHKATGRLYIGSKQLHFWNGVQGGYKCTEPTSDQWDGSLWHESDWREYKSSAVDVARAATEEPWAWDYRVIGLHKNKLSLNLSEVMSQVEANVLEATDANGDYLYLNANVMGKEYRPAVPMAKLIAQVEDSKAALRDYYLKPTMCSRCNSLIPFGDTRCPNAPLFGDGDCNEPHNTND